MQIGLIGAGNMAQALARGWGEPLLVYDPVAERSEALAAELGGEALASNAEVAERADAIVLCHKPAQLATVAEEIGGRARTVVSILAATPVSAVEEAYPGVPVYRVLPNLAAEVRQGVFCWTPGRLAADGPEAELRAQFERLGAVVSLEDQLVDAAMAVMSCGPAFYALVVEAMADAGVRHGLGPADAHEFAVEAMAGTAALLRDHAPSELRRRVVSPGGTTARGLAALERAGTRAAFHDAVDAALGKERG
jgi:pyrroline-5-carboxylate reductase